MSISSSSDFDDDSNWLLDLDTALLENCDFFKLRSICRHRPVPKNLRSDVWKICLNIQSKSDALDGFNDVFDLANQDLLHEHCREFVSTLPKDFFSNSIGFISDIESILTHFSRVYRVEYRENNGWLSILRVLCCELRLTNRSELYHVFTAICHRFLPGSSVVQEEGGGEMFSVFRLLLQYHDPELCSFLDTHRVSSSLFARDWFCSLLSSQLQHEVLVELWDILFLDSDPFLTVFLSLVVLLNVREALLELRGQPAASIVSTIRGVLPQLGREDLADFYELAVTYLSRTPRSFSAKFAAVLFGNGRKDEETQQLLDSLCLSVTVQELLDNTDTAVSGTVVKELQDSSTCRATVKYFLVDCRPPEHYNCGHLPSAYFLDSQLLLSSPEHEFRTSLEALLATQQQALASFSKSAGEHICFLGDGGDGDSEVDQLVNMVVAQFLRRLTKHVSVVHGGYRAIHEALGPHCDSFLDSHDPACCRGCARHSVTAGGSVSLALPHNPPHTPTATTIAPTAPPRGNLIDKFSSALISRLNSSKSKTTERTATKTYRNTGNIFSIEDDGDDDSVHNYSGSNQATSPEMINLDLWSRKPDVLRIFECYVVDDDGSLNQGSLLLTKTNLFVLKKSVSSSSLSKLENFYNGGIFKKLTTMVPVSQNMVTIHRRRTLSRVVKITSKKKIPECLTFHYLVNDDDGTVERDRYILEEAGDAARVIKMQIQKVLDEADLRE